MNRRSKYIWSRVDEMLIQLASDSMRARYEMDEANGIDPSRPIKDLGLRLWKGELVYVTKQLRAP